MSREQQIAWNRQTQNDWEAFREHRRRMTELLTQLAPRPAGRLAVMGAGNCNDLDLSALSEIYPQIELLDWDRDAVLRGVRRQGLAEGDTLRIPAAADLCQTPPPEGLVAADCVASLGLLSQMMLAVTARQDPRFPERTINAAATLREQHFRCLLARMRPGARAVLSFEIVSSDTLPGLADCPLEAVARLTAAAVGAGNFYTGLHPAALFNTAQQLQREQQLEQVTMHPPWKWCLGPRIYAVAALSFHRPNSGKFSYEK